MNPNLSNSSLIVVHRERRVADFPLTTDYVDNPETFAEGSTYQGHDGRLDDLVIYQDADGNYFYQVEYVPDLTMDTMWGKEKKAGKLVPLESYALETTEYGTQGVLSETFDDVRLPLMADKTGHALGDDINDELKVRLISSHLAGHSKTEFIRLSIYGNVAEAKGSTDYQTLARMQDQMGIFGSLSGSLDMNGDGVFEEGVEPGDPHPDGTTQQMSVVFERRALD